MPLRLFDVQIYGASIGVLRMPAFLAAAVAPFAVAIVLERFGAEAVLLLSMALAAAVLAASLVLRERARRLAALASGLDTASGQRP